MTADVAIVGGGVIGLSIGWRAAEAGLTAVVVDDARPERASHAAAGMLAPVTEVHYGEEPLLALNLASAARWPAFATDLEAAAGRGVGYRTDGTLAVAFDADDLRALGDLLAFQRQLGLEVEALDRKECRRLEPLLHPRVQGGVLSRGDHQVDNRLLVAALADALARAGGRVLAGRVAAVRPGEGITLADGTAVPAARVVVAAGCWSPELAAVAVRPVKGQILRLRGRPGQPLLERTVRGLARGWSVYLVPRAGGEVVVGATVEELGFDDAVTAGGVHDLLRAAIDLVPGVSELALVECAAGLRPGTPDNAPLLGVADADGVILATGHYRNGILLAPVTADAVVALLRDEPVPAVVAPFTPRRFAA